MPRYSAKLMEHFHNPHNTDNIEGANLIGRADLDGRAPRVEIQIKLTDNTVEAIRFSAFGCGVTIAACSAVTKLAQGQSRQDCMLIGKQNVIDELGGVPGDKRFCADLAVDALQNALRGR